MQKIMNMEECLLGKTVKSGNKEKIFTKDDLVEKLHFNEIEVEIVIKYQKEFPELLQEHREDSFIIDGRNLWEKLEKPQGDFSNWITRKIISKGYIENVDYSSFHGIVEREVGASKSINYKFTVDTAKHIALSENIEKGKEISSYFILMERAIREMNNWLLIRHPERAGYTQLCRTLDANYQLTHKGKLANEHIFSNEANMINKCLLGANAKKIRQLLDMGDNQTREHLALDVNKALYEIQIMDSGLVMAGLAYADRKMTIEKVCSTKYLHIKPIVKELEKVM